MKTITRLLNPNSIDDTMNLLYLKMAGGQGGLMWALIFITIALRFSPKRLENFIGFNHKASDLGYYASYDLNYLQKCDFALKTLFPVQNKENDAMADHRQRHQITTRNSKNNILHGVTLLILISGDIAENPGPIKFPCGSCTKPVMKNQKERDFRRSDGDFGNF
jgi:hypothetical protein